MRTTPHGSKTTYAPTTANWPTLLCPTHWMRLQAGIGKGIGSGRLNDQEFYPLDPSILGKTSLRRKTHGLALLALRQDYTCERPY